VTGLLILFGGIALFVGTITVLDLIGRRQQRHAQGRQ
jgi:uncharacterized membrane protein YgdD (TMEM256/DUF423 family)